MPAAVGVGGGSVWVADDPADDDFDPSIDSNGTISLIGKAWGPHGSVRTVTMTVARVNDRRLWWMAAGAFAYAALRGVEAYGLWRARVWAEWVAILGGALYLPIEIYGLVEHATAPRLVVFLVNLGIVAYVLSVRLSGSRASSSRGPRAQEPARRPG